MQIHELTQPKKTKLDEAGFFNSVGDAIKSGGDTLKWGDTGQQARRDAEQGRVNTQAAKAVAKLEKNLPPTESVPTLDQAIAKLKANPAAQQWINGVVAKWPAVAKQLAVAPTPTTTATTPSTVTLGGKKLDPKYPGDAATLAALAKQGIKEAPEYTTPGGIVVPANVKTAQAPATGDQTYADGFRKWVNSALKTTSLEKLESDPDVRSKLDPLLKQIVAAKDNETEQQKLVQTFFSLAVAANHVVQAKEKDPLTRAGTQPNTSAGKQSTANQQAVDTGLSATDLYMLNQAARRSGEPAPTKSTGNKWFDSLVQQIWNGR